jgi:hypothetical protein
VTAWEQVEWSALVAQVRPVDAGDRAADLGQPLSRFQSAGDEESTGRRDRSSAYPEHISES